MNIEAEYIERLSDAKWRIEYLTEIVKVQEQVIRQLAGEKLDVVYIHPFDLYDLLIARPDDSADVIAIPNTNGWLITRDIRVGDVLYRRTDCMPAKNKDLV